MKAPKGMWAKRLPVVFKVSQWITCSGSFVFKRISAHVHMDRSMFMTWFRFR